MATYGGKADNFRLAVTLDFFTGEPEKWDSWRDRFIRWLSINDVEDQEKKLNILLHYGGEKLNQIVPNLPRKPGESVRLDVDVFEEMIRKLDEFYAGSVCRTANRYKLYMIRQEEGERWQMFVARVRTAARKCGWKIQEVEDEHIVDQLVMGCKDSNVRKRLMLKDYGLEEAIKFGETTESLNANLMPFASGHASERSVNRIQSGPETPELTCWNCGKTGHFKTSPQCPARGAKCQKCGKLGHFAIKCRSMPMKRFGEYKRTEYRPKSGSKRPAHSPKSHGSSKVRRVTKEEAESEDEKPIKSTLFHLGDGEYIHCTIGGVKMAVLVDSGAARNVLSEVDYDQVMKKGGQIVRKCIDEEPKVFAFASKEPLKIVASFSATIQAGKSATKTDFLVIEGGEASLLSYQTAKRLNVIRIRIDLQQIKQETQEFPKMKGVQARVNIDPKVTPVIQPFRPIPIAYEQLVEEQIAELLRKGIIEEAPGPVEWLSPIVVVKKENGELRICVDMRQPNRAVLRDHYPMPTIESILHRLRGAKIFSKLDIKQAFHQVELHPESRYITTFVTHRGCYRYKRLPFGLSTAPEIFQRTGEIVVSGLKGVGIYLDDIVVFGETQEEHDARLAALERRLNEFNIRLNEEKKLISVERVDFLGHTLSADGIEPQPAKTLAVEKMRPPTTKEETRSFLGLVTFLQKFIPDVATTTEQLRRLVLKDIQFVWGEAEERAFQKLRKEISKKTVLRFFDPSLSTELMCDASPSGLGAVLLQVDSDGTRRPVEFASRSLTSLEMKYSQTEREALAIVWSMERFSVYLLGRHFILWTDCKPLVYLFAPKAKVNARLERWVLRLQNFDYEMRHLSGKENFADALSRLSVVRGPMVTNETNVWSLVLDRVPKAIKIHELEEAARSDNEIEFVRKALASNVWKDFEQYGIPKRTAILYGHCEPELCIVGDLLLKGERIVIPEALRQRTLQIAHESHPGAPSMKRLLRTKVWWPGLDESVDNYVKDCRECLLVAKPSPPEPLKRTILPSEPWEAIALDFLGPLPNGHHLLVIVDYFSRWLEVYITKDTTSSFVIKSLEESFASFGLPRSLQVDNAPNLMSQEIAEFCDEKDINLVASTPFWPQRNGEVERQNRNLMRRIRIGAHEKKDLRQIVLEFLCQYRTTPHSTTGKSPAELMFGRRPRGKLPSLISGFVDDEEVRERDGLMKELGKQYADLKRKATPSNLRPKDIVVVIDEKPINKESTRFKEERYMVLTKSGAELVLQSTETGKIIRRNAAHVKLATSREQEVEGKTSEDLEVDKEVTPSSNVNEATPFSKVNEATPCSNADETTIGDGAEAELEAPISKPTGTGNTRTRSGREVKRSSRLQGFDLMRIRDEKPVGAKF